MRRTVAKGATIDELARFLYVANRLGLDPLVNQVHLTHHKTGQGETTISVIVGIDGFRAIAERTHEYAGSDDALFDYGPNYKSENGEPINPTKATVTVYRIVKGQRVSFTATARWKEYKPSVADFMWKRMPYAQLAKCAEALALRKAFPHDLSGVYVQEELDQAATKENRAEIVVTPAATMDTTMAKWKCVDCGVEITKAEADYSLSLIGKTSCRECQKPTIGINN